VGVNHSLTIWELTKKKGEGINHSLTIWKLTKRAEGRGVNHSPTIWELTRKLDYSGPCFITFQANMARCSNNCTTNWHVANIVAGSEMGYNFPPSKNNEWLLLLQTVINMIRLLNVPSLSMMWEGEAQFLM